MDRNWYAVIEASILYDKQITDRQKIIIAVLSNYNTNTVPIQALKRATRANDLDIKQDVVKLRELGYVSKSAKIIYDGEG